VTSSVSNK